jgi:hypothetical protein
MSMEAEVFEQVLIEGERSGQLRLADPRHTARTLLHATNGLLPYSLSGRELGARPEVESRVEGLAELLIQGLRRSEAQSA